MDQQYLPTNAKTSYLKALVIVVFSADVNTTALEK